MQKATRSDTEQNTPRVATDPPRTPSTSDVLSKVAGSEQRGSSKRKRGPQDGCDNDLEDKQTNKRYKANDLSASKHKREVQDEYDEDTDYKHTDKKRKPTDQSNSRPETPFPGTSRPSTPRLHAATPTPLEVKTRPSPASEPPAQLPSPPSSTATPDRDHATEERHDVTEKRQVASPKSEDNQGELQEPVSPSDGSSSQSEKRRRNETDATSEQSKRLCQSGAVKNFESPTTPLVTISQPPLSKSAPLKASAPQKPEDKAQGKSHASPQQTPPVQQACAQPVRPKSSFAPVEPNHGCDLKFLEYLDDSVPVFYSPMIEHTHDTALSNNPPGILVLDALVAIEACGRSSSRTKWPSSIELLGRNSKGADPVKVIDDVDLYLHESNGKLHVATDRGLLHVAEYLKLIGVPTTQPVRFEGSVPPWAKTAMASREKRRVVEIWGEDKLVKKGTPLEQHQVGMTLESHIEVLEERAKEEASRRSKHGKPASQEVGNVQILETDPGDIPLPLGSVVVVYTLDDDDVWAYGRLMGTNKVGRFPIAHTCPMDWSQDRFVKPNYSLNEPLPTDPEEPNWRGLFHWAKQRGYPEGPTWKETVARTAAKAAADRALKIAIAEMKTKANVALTLKAIEPPQNVGNVSTKKLLPATSPETITARADTKTSVTLQAESAEKLSEKPQGSISALEKDLLATADPNTATTKVDIKADVTRKSKTTEILQEISSAAANGTPPVEVPKKTNAGSPSTMDIKVQDTPKTTITKVAESCVAKDTEPSRSRDPAPAKSAEAVDEPPVAIIETPVSIVSRPTEEGRVDPNATTSAQSENRYAETRDDCHSQGLDPKQKDSAVGVSIDTVTASQNPFTKPRYDLFARNDDIEYDWGDSDEEL